MESEKGRIFADESFPLCVITDSESGIDTIEGARKAVHEAIEIKYFYEGRSTLLIGNKTVNAEAGDIIIINPYGVIPKDVNVPIIAIGSIEKQPNADCISIDFLGGITTAIAHLKENGHTLIGFLGETFTKIKEPIFKKAMNKNSLLVNEDYIFRSNKRFKEAGIDFSNAEFAS